MSFFYEFSLISKIYFCVSCLVFLGWTTGLVIYLIRDSVFLDVSQFLTWLRLESLSLFVVSGSVIGSLLDKIFPESVILNLVTAILVALLSVRMIKKSFSIYDHESQLGTGL